MPKISSTQKSLQIKFHNLKKPLGFFLAFFIFLLTIPSLVALTIPCLKPTPGAVYEINDCVLDTAFDRYLILALSGFAFFVLVHFVSMKNKRLKPLLGTAVILALGIILFFHLYIPQAEAQMRNSPQYLTPTLP